MAHFWTEAAGGWERIPLVDDAYSLGTTLSVLDDDDNVWDAAVIQSRGEEGRNWALLSRSDVYLRVNGRMTAGIRVLADRDQIQLADQTYYFSTEELVRVVRFPGGHGVVDCPRCRRVLASGDESVCCPRCGIWHHQTEEYPCWTYEEASACCEHPTELTVSYRKPFED